MNPAGRGEAGVVYVEFLFAFLPVFLLFLGIVQLALLFGAKATVAQAASAGARSAAVVLPDDPARYEGTGLGVVRLPPSARRGPGTQRQAQQQSAHLATLLGGKARASNTRFPGGRTRDRRSPRLVAIERAVYFPLAGLAPSIGELETFVPGLGARSSLRDAVGGVHAGRAAVGLLLYNSAVTAITFPTGEDSEDAYDQRVDPSVELVHVRVLHLFRCAVPLVAAIMCRALPDLGVSALGGVKEKRDVPRRLTRQLQAIPSQTALKLLAASGQRVFPFEAQASFPIQRARYPYASR